VIERGMIERGVIEVIVRGGVIERGRLRGEG
jgi:hypothetical protein